MWIKLPNNGGLLNLDQVMRFQIAFNGTYIIQAVTEASASTTVGTGYSTEADAQAALDAFLVWDLNA